MPKAETANPGHTALSPLRALVVLGGVILALAGYMALGALLHVGPLFVGVLMLFYWYSIKGGETDALPGAVVGALGGVANAMLFALPGVSLGVAALIGLAALALALYALLTGFCPLVFNSAYMLVITVTTIPAVLAKSDVFGMVEAIALATIYFGAITAGVRWATRRRAGLTATPRS